MARKSKTSTRKQKSAPRPRGAMKPKSVKNGNRRSRVPDAIAFLENEHREVEKLFESFEKARSDDKKEGYADRICLELRIHTRIEEEILYPPARATLDDDFIVDEAVVEHDSAKALIAQIEGMRPGDDFYDAKVKVLSEHIEHHVEEEEEELFPQLRESGIDLVALGERLRERKDELLAQMAQRD